MKKILLAILSLVYSSHNEQFSYIREFDSEQTRLFKNEFDFKTTDIDWTEDSILKIARWRIKSVKIEGNKKVIIFIYIKISIGSIF